MAGIMSERKEGKKEGRDGGKIKERGRERKIGRKFDGIMRGEKDAGGG